MIDSKEVTQVISRLNARTLHVFQITLQHCTIKKYAEIFHLKWRLKIKRLQSSNRYEIQPHLKLKFKMTELSYTRKKSNETIQLFIIKHGELKDIRCMYRLPRYSYFASVLALNSQNDIFLRFNF